MTPIPGWEHYSIDEDGNVFSIYSGLVKLRRTVLSKFGYKRVTLTKNKKPKTLVVHRLVALTFIANPNNEPWINHKDGNKQNNHVSNLEWSNRIHNAKHARENGLYRIGEKHANAKLTENQARWIKYVGPKLGFKQHEMMHMFDASQVSVSLITRGVTWKHI